MYSIDVIQRDYAPRRRIAAHLPELPALIKMNEADSAFICGLLERFRPRKIVEVGIGHGGTTAVMMQCLHDLHLHAEICCVDVLKRGYGGTDLDTGFLGEEASRLLSYEGLRLFTGVCLPQAIDRIGGDIDFLLLDTMHKLPGETLDFLIAYPFLSKGAVVCLHDIIQNQKKPPDQRRIATNVLFNSVVADKYINTDPERKAAYPNIGAFRLRADTEAYLTNVFGALTQNWSYFPPVAVMDAYAKKNRARYPAEARWLYECAAALNAP